MLRAWLSASALVAALAAHSAAASFSFAGSNLYYAAGLYPQDRDTLLSGLQSAGMKVLRVWLDGQSETQKGTNIRPFPSLEPTQVCNGVASCYNDTVLERLDEWFLPARAHGIKLLISMHSYNALPGDVYGQTYGVTGFYEDADAQAAFDARLRHVLEHVHPTLGPWKDLDEYIFGFEAENEAMIGIDGTGAYIRAHQEWQCDRANTIRGELGSNEGILVLTGGESWVDESVQDGFLSCPTLDVISLHAYSPGDFNTTFLQTYIQRAQTAGKKLLMEEWGACYYDTDQNNCPSGDALPTATRNTNLQTWASEITAAGLPWLYWQVIPNADPHWGGDYEIGVNTDPSWSTLEAASLAALQAPAAFDFGPWLL
ncbi:glycoside hydrolase family 5 protein [Phanerochaete sordida]|uniref:mannan endo-1,4-beta-mannosidase n=1 Tax=Phanerochaete sordida TaxID=48140 RepID=A0A9P3LL15_9APHY|nr:glycoside hydrolase family 5 protein [Phanerochaete sordida]